MDYRAFKVAVALVLVMNNVFVSVTAEGSLAEQAYESAKQLKDDTGKMLYFVTGLRGNRNAKPEPPIIERCIRSYNFLDVRAKVTVEYLEDLSGDKDKVSNAVKSLQNTSSEAFRCPDLFKDNSGLKILYNRIYTDSKFLAQKITDTENLANQLLQSLRQARPNSDRE